MHSKLVTALALLPSTAVAAPASPVQYNDCAPPPPPPPCPSADVSCGNEGISFKVFEDAWPYGKLKPTDWDHTTLLSKQPVHSGVRDSLGFKNDKTPGGGITIYKAPVYGSKPINLQRNALSHEFNVYAGANPTKCKFTMRPADDAQYLYLGGSLAAKQYWVTGGKEVSTTTIDVEAGMYVPVKLYSGNLGGPQNTNLEVECNGELLIGPNITPKRIVHKICNPESAKIYKPTATTKAN